MRTTRPLTLLIALLTTSFAASPITYDEAEARARRFFDNNEWASANAMYNHMIYERPTAANNYGVAIVVNNILNDTVRASQLLEQAMSYGIPIDTVLTDVRRYAYLAKHPDVYPDFLARTSAHTPWMKRAIDLRLLNYCKFRNDGDGMIYYARQLLNGADNNPEFLMALANGYMMKGMPHQAVETWIRLLNMNPDHYQALICLANYYDYNGDRAQALHYFTAARAIKPTPYIARAIDRLSH